MSDNLNRRVGGIKKTEELFDGYNNNQDFVINVCNLYLTGSYTQEQITQLLIPEEYGKSTNVAVGVIKKILITNLTTEQRELISDSNRRNGLRSDDHEVQSLRGKLGGKNRGLNSSDAKKMKSSSVLGIEVRDLLYKKYLELSNAKVSNIGIELAVWLEENYNIIKTPGALIEVVRRYKKLLKQEKTPGKFLISRPIKEDIYRIWEASFPERASNVLKSEWYTNLAAQINERYAIPPTYHLQNKQIQNIILYFQGTKKVGKLQK